MKLKEFLLVLCLVAVTVAVFQGRSQETGKAPTPTPTPIDEKPTVTLKVVRRSARLDDLVVTGKLSSPRRIKLALRDDLPVTYLMCRIGNRGFDLVHHSLAEEGYPPHLPAGQFVRETREVQDFEWEFWGREMTWSRREVIEDAFANAMQLETRIPYENPAFKPGDPLYEKYKFINTQLEIPALSRP